MGLTRSESIASSGVGSGFHDIPQQSNPVGPDAEKDDLLQPPSFEAGIFGVLFTLSQAKSHDHVHFNWTILKNILAAWQLFTVIVNPDLGWDIDPDSTLWKCISVLTFGWLGDLGYTWYTVGLYTWAVILVVSLALCVWVAWSFKEQKVDYVWPIKVIRAFSYVFLQLFDITTLSFLQLGISCNYVGAAQPHLHMALFPDYSCSELPQIANAIISGVLLLVYILMALLVNMSEVEVNPASRSPRAVAHSGSEVAAFAIKVLLTLVGAFLGFPKPAAVVYSVLAGWLLWEYLRWVPHVHLWVNGLRCGIALAIFEVACVQVAVAFMVGSGGAAHGAKADIAHMLTLAMVLGLAPAFVLGAVAAWLRTKVLTARVLKAFKTADPEAIKPQDIYHFNHPRDVEVAARTARVWVDLYTLEKTAVHRAEAIIKAGIALFPDDAFVSIVYADFMLDMLGFSQTGAKQLEAVRKLSPGIMVRFMLFIRQQHATQKAASSTLGKGANMDLLGYVEYQRKQRMVLRHHKDALQAMANFWRILGASSIHFTSLSKSLEEIDTSVTKAESGYRVALELYNNSPKLVRLYARFLETIKQDPWAASQYYASADRLEESKDYQGQGPSLPDGTPMSRMDDVEKGILVVNAFGDIQVANRKLLDMFGYKKGELDGKNVTVLMPPHEAKRHPATLRRYIDSGDKAPPYFRHPVLGIHRERVALTVRIAVSRASGLGEDSVFIGILEPVAMEPGLGRVWVTREGVIVCCDPGFVTCFGYRPDDVIGTQLNKLMRSSSGGADQASDVWLTNQANHDKQELVHKLLEEAANATAVTLTEPVTCHVRHKYDVAKDCSVCVKKDLHDASILEVCMQLQSNEPQLLMVVERKGAIRHMSGDLANVLGVRAGGDGPQAAQNQGPGAHPADLQGGNEHVMLELMTEALPYSLDDFLPSPWKLLHHKYRKYVKSGSSSLLSGAWGCRATLDATNNRMGPTMRLVGLHGKPVFVHVAVSSREEEGEPVHVVSMARSSLETSIAERCLRLRISEDGLVQDLQPLRPTASRMPQDNAVAAENLPDIFGFSSDELVGRRMSEFVSLVAPRKTKRRGGGNGGGKTVDVLNETEAALATAGVAASIASVGPKPELKYESLDPDMLDSMVTSALQTPGLSWRVNIVSPDTAAEAAALGNGGRAAAVLARRTKEAVLRLDVSLLPAAAGGGGGRLQVHAELWAAEATTAVVEINASGRISSILEEDIRPPGLLFGLPKDEVGGAQLEALLKLGPGQSAQGLLTESGVAKKSSLKSSKGKTSTKIGPIHYMDGIHRDGQPLHLAVQVVGRPGTGNPVTAVIRFASDKSATAQRTRKKAAAAAAAAAAASAATAARVRASKAGAGPPHLRLGRGAGGHGPPGAEDKATTFRPGTSFRLSPSIKIPDEDAVEDAATSLPGTPQLAAGPAPGSTAPPVLGSTVEDGSEVSPVLAQLLPGASTLAAGVACLITTKARTGIVGAGRAGAARGKPSTLPAAAESTADSAAADEGPEAAAAVAGAVDSGGVEAATEGGEAAAGTNLPPRRQESNDSDRMSRILNDVEQQHVQGGQLPKGELVGFRGGKGTKGDLLIDVASTGYTDASSLQGRGQSKQSVLEPGIGGVDKWVATGGEFYQNRAPSASTRASTEAGLDDTEDDGDSNGEREDDDDGGSADALSLAASSRFASPLASEYDTMPDEATGVSGGGGGGGGGGAGFPHPHRHLHHHQHHRLAAASGPFGAPGRQPGMSHPYGVSHPYGMSHPYGGSYPVPYGQQEQQQQQHHRLHHQRMGGAGAGPDANGDWMAGGEQQQMIRGGNDDDTAEEGRGGGAGDIQGDGDSDGDSDETGVTGQSDPAGVVDMADYKRGKRYRKLVKLMNSPQAQKAVTRLKINTTIAILAAAAVHVVSFALIISGIKSQSEALTTLASIGGGQRYLQRALVSVRALDQSYKGKGTNGTYGPADAETFANDLLTYSNMYRDVTRLLMETEGGSIENMLYTRKLHVWSGYNASTAVAFNEDMTLWDILTRVFVSAKSVFQNHVTWHQQGLNISSMLPAEFLIRSGQDLVLGMEQVIEEVLSEAIQWTGIVNSLQLTFLLVEGCLVTCGVAIGLLYMLKSAFDQRYMLYETFLAIPIGLTRALAAQTTHLLDDDESDDPDDEDELYDDDTGSGRGRNTAPKRKALFEESPLPNDPPPGDRDSPRPHQQHPPFPHQLQQERTRARDAALASPFQRPGGGGGGRSRRTSAISIIPVNGLPSPGVRGPGPASAQGSRQRRNSVLSEVVMGGTGPRPRRASITMSEMSGYSLLPTAVGQPVSRAMPVERTGCWRWFKAKFRRSNSVKPLPTDPTNQSRRTLVRNSRVANGMLSIVIVYSVLVILFYSINYAILLGVDDKVAQQHVADLTTERNYRTIFYAQELSAEEDVTVVPLRVGAVRNASASLRDAYYTMRMGQGASSVVGPSIEHFPWVTGNGLVKDSQTMFDLFYGDNVCLRLPEHFPCPPPNYRFYEVTRSGADGMMNQMLSELKYIADEAEAVYSANNGSSPPGLASPFWDYIYNVGTVDLNDACRRISDQHVSDVQRVLDVVVILHVALFLLLAIVFICFLVLGYLPLLHRMDQEKRRIAEMMSQLPPELDVLKLFNTALMGAKAAAQVRPTATHRNSSMTNVSMPGGAGGGGGGGPYPAPTQVLQGGPPTVATAAAANSFRAPGKAGAGVEPGAGSNTEGDSKAYHAWKDILSRTSVNGGNISRLKDKA